MADKKRQHTVQKAYLDQWEIDDEFFIYDFKKKALHPGKPKSIFRENNIYNWDYLEGKDKFVIDDLITDIENNGLPVVKKIQYSRINSEEKYLLSKYIALQLLRTPMAQEFFHELRLAMSKNNLINVLKDTIKKKKLLEDSPESQRKLIKELAGNPEKNVNDINKKFLLKIVNIREIWLQGSLKMLEQLAKHYFECPWHILKSGKNTSFITSDNPVVSISQVKNKLSVTKKDVNFTETTYPLSPKLIILIIKEEKTFSSDNEIRETMFPESPKSVRELNCRTAIFSDRYIISHSKDLLYRIAKTVNNDWESMRKDKKKYDDRSKGLIPVSKRMKSIQLISSVFE